MREGDARTYGFRYVYDRRVIVNPKNGREVGYAMWRDHRGEAFKYLADLPIYSDFDEEAGF